MTLHSSPAVALYQGNARLWQDANLIQAPSIEFDRDRRALVAQGTAVQPISTVLVQAAEMDRGKAGGTSAPRSKNLDRKAVPSSTMTISAAKRTYEDSERRARYEGGVVGKGNGFTASASVIDAFLMPRSQSHGNQALARPSQLDRMVAEGEVSIQQANRRAAGEHLEYSAAEDKFVLTGGPPSIFDAERGKITGVSLTLFRHDGRVVVEGNNSSPTVTQTKVAR
jgi:lipopolysaccharide export system protein LptA